ncbi:MAG: PEGA domain-containing protein [Labilithrix sp.]|nr:PEGA domain-containing protein [Labilithrix sp.]
MLGLLVALALGGAARSAYARPDDSPSKDASAVDAAARERSRAAFRRGVAELRAEDWAGARASFEEAWSLVQHPSILLNLGIARLRTDDPVLAEQDLVRFLSEDSGATSEELASAREALGEARSKIGTLRVIATPATARVVIDGHPAGVRAPSSAGQGGVAEARLKAGEHTVVVEAEGFRADRRSVAVAPKSETELGVVLTAEGATPSRSEGTQTRAIVGWSLGGVSGVALAASGVMALRAMSLSSDYADRGSPSFQDRDVKDEGIAFRTGADVALVTALLAGAGAVILLFTDIGASDAPGVARLGAPRPALVRW